ncbi:MAG: 50S ribosomal protein L3 [Candidatus Shikimatogenerans sp. JK-2022]|nr:50S ribosomal protein L3 [Candidatus Shikimatogenerans bostrichidophilus]
MIKIFGQKIQMISFIKYNSIIPCTIVKIEKNRIINIEKKEKKNYVIFLGYKKIKKINKPLEGFFKKYKSKYYRKIIQLNNINIKEIKFLKKKFKKKYIDINLFKKGEKIDITGYTIGKGFQGVVKRHKFSGVGESTHGQHNRLRSPGSIGAGSSPSRVFKGMKMAGRMGNKKRTIKNIEILDIDLKEKILLLKGSIMGKNNLNNFLIIKKKCI